MRSTAVRVQTIYQKDDILAVRHNRRREISPFWLAVLLEDVQIEVNGGNFVQQRVSLKWLNQTSDSLTYTSGDVCNGNSPKCILTRVLDFSSDGSDIILTTEEDNRLCRIANGDYGDDDDNENETAPPTAEDDGEVSLPIRLPGVSLSGRRTTRFIPNVSSPVDSAEGKISKVIPVPSKAEMDVFYAKLSKSTIKPIALSLIPEYADSYVLKSRCVPTISDLFDKKYLDLCYPELLKACHEVDIKITKEQITQVERDSVTQAKGNSFFRHRAGRIGASQSKTAYQTNPAMPSQSLIQSICYPELNKLNTKAIIHGSQHEEETIRAYEEIMKKQHINFKIEKCGLMISEEYPWLRELQISCAHEAVVEKGVVR